MNFAVGILGFAVMTAYVPGISGAASWPRWGVIVAAWFLTMMLPRLRPTVSGLAALAFATWCAVTLAWGPPLGGIDAAGKLLLLAGAFCLGAALSDLDALFIGAAWGMVLNACVAIMQWYGFDGLVQTASPAGLFINKNHLAEAAALVLVYAAATYRFCFWPALVTIITLAQAWAAILAALAASVIWTWSRGAAGLLIAGAVIALAFKSSASVNERLAIWGGTLDGLTWLGRGFGSFVEDLPRFIDLSAFGTRPEQAHNEFLQLAFETGAPGLALFGLLIVLLLRGPMTAPRLVLIAILVESLFAFPLHLAATGFLGAVVAGRLSRDGADLRGALGRSRMALRQRLEIRRQRRSVVHRSGARP